MDFNLPEELQILKTTVARFVNNELIPAGAGVSAGRRGDARAFAAARCTKK